MYKISYKNSFKKDYKRCLKRGYDEDLMLNVIRHLARKGNLHIKYKPHKLSGNYEGFWECHIKPDWLLIWIKDDSNKTITLVRTGTHSDLF